MYCRGVCLCLCIVEVCSSVIKDISDLNKVHTSCSRFRDDGHNNFCDDENIRNNRCHANSAKKKSLKICLRKQNLGYTKSIWHFVLSFCGFVNQVQPSKATFLNGY